MANIEELLPIIRKAVREEILLEITPRLANLECKKNELTEIRKTLDTHKTSLDEHETSITINGEKIKQLFDESMPHLESKFDELNEKICLNILNIETHRKNGH